MTPKSLFMLSRPGPLPATLILSFLSPLAWSAGAELPVIAISSQGSSNANAAEANDASVLFYNPAGMSRLRGSRISLPVALIAASSKVTDQGTTRLQDMGQAPDTGPTADCTQYDCMSDPNPSPAMPAVKDQPEGLFPAVLPVGAFFATTPYDESITLGIGVFSPGGGNLNYKSNWFGRHFIDSAAIELININPSVAIRFDDKHSVGFGVSALVGHAKFKLQIDVNKVAPYLLQGVLDSPESVIAALPAGLGGVLSTAQIDQLVSGLVGVAPDQVKGVLASLLAGQGVPGLGVANPALAGVSLVDPTSTASGTVETIGFGYGWNAGYFYQFSDETRLGISYRSKSDVRMNGELDWDFSDARTSALGNAVIGNLESFLVKNYRPDTDARLVFTVPAKFNVGFFSALSSKVDWMLNYTFNQTSVVKNLKVDLPNQSASVKAEQGGVVLAQHWRDSFTLATGINYHWDDTLVLRTGLQFDQTPVPSAKYRHPALADNDRWMLSVGLGYQLNRNTSIDLAYSYLHIMPSQSNNHDPCSGVYFEGSTTQSPSECTSNGGTFRARYDDTHAHILGAQLNQKF